MRHSKAHLTRAVLEDVAYGLRDSLELMRALGPSNQRVRASAGGPRRPLWRQILAGVFEAEIAAVNVTEGAAYGAALLAGVGSGVYHSVNEACDKAIRLTGRIKPGPAVSTYAAYCPRYRALYAALRQEFAALAKVVSKDTTTKGSN